MAAVSAQTVRTRFRDRVATVSGLTESQVILSPAADPSSVLDGRFSVTIGESVPVGYRQKPGEGSLVNTLATVQMVHRIKPKDQWTSADTALSRTQSIVQALMVKTGTWQEDLQVLWTGNRLEQLTGETLLTTITFRVQHLYALT